MGCENRPSGELNALNSQQVRQVTRVEVLLSTRCCVPFLVPHVTLLKFVLWNGLQRGQTDTE